MIHEAHTLQEWLQDGRLFRVARAGDRIRSLPPQVPGQSGYDASKHRVIDLLVPGKHLIWFFPLDYTMVRSAVSPNQCHLQLLESRQWVPPEFIFSMDVARDESMGFIDRQIQEFERRLFEVLKCRPIDCWLSQRPWQVKALTPSHFQCTAVVSATVFLGP
jgi:hypothetical protein